MEPAAAGGGIVRISGCGESGWRALDESACARESREFIGGFWRGSIINIANNLPVGLIAGSALHSAPEAVRKAVLIGVDLGPNLSVSGSLATILWLIALRKEGEDVSFWTFLGYGVVVMPVALVLAVLASGIGAE